ncbi:MAG: acetate kinase [Cyanobacteria bacterium RYN_339]|nr:acetate kinase [Cyanobacteria bacterium RYN_339]
MTGNQPTRVLTLNAGSSSLKAALYAMGPGEELALAAELTRIGGAGGRFQVRAAGRTVLDQAVAPPDHAAALELLMAWLAAQGGPAPAAVGHRVVHGGARYGEPTRVTPELIAALRALEPIDPLHMPQALAGFAAVERSFPGIPQIACFDTAFHQAMPRLAKAYPLAASLDDEGIRRYGFHGLSYEFVLQALREADPAAAHGRVILAHLGNGASMAAVLGGRPQDTTMGFSPTGGLMMGTRTGDLDPGVLLYLLRRNGADELDALVNRQAGLLGVSGTSADMRDLLAHEATDARAQLAVDLFCYQARKALGGLAAVLGGLDTLVFTGGIGEHAPAVRARICAGLGYLGVQLADGHNAAGGPLISDPSGPVQIRVIPTDEDRMIARHTHRVLAHGG